MRSNLYTVLYAAALGLISAALLTGAEKLTGTYKDANMRAEKIRNILNVLQVPYAPSANAKEIVEIFKLNITEKKTPNLTMYLYTPAGNAGPWRRNRLRLIH